MSKATQPRCKQASFPCPGRTQLTYVGLIRKFPGYNPYNHRPLTAPSSKTVHLQSPQEVLTVL